MSSDEGDDRVGVRPTRFVESLLRHLKNIVERFHVKHLSKRADALPARKAKNFSEGVVNSGIAASHVCC